MTTAVILVAGPMPPLDQPGAVADGSTLGERLSARVATAAPDLMVAADGGLDLALALGLTPDHVVGDMDSVSRGAIGLARAAGMELTEVPRAKDASDYELALDLAVAQGADHLLVVGGASGRLDHIFATLLTLTSAKYDRLVIEGWLVDNYLAVINGAAGAAAGEAGAERASSRALIEGRAGDQVSLFAFNGPARGVSTTGLRWALSGAELHGGTSLGVSNEMLGERATVDLEAGTLAVIRTVGGER